MEELKDLHIGVLMGGLSSEREISLKSGRAVYDALSWSGFKNVVPVDISSEDKEGVICAINNAHIDIAFITLHGRFGEDGQRVL